MLFAMFIIKFLKLHIVVMLFVIMDIYVRKRSIQVKLVCETVKAVVYKSGMIS